MKVYKKYFIFIDIVSLVMYIMSTVDILWSLKIMSKYTMNPIEKHFAYLKAVFQEAVNIRERSLDQHNCLDNEGIYFSAHDDMCFHGVADPRWQYLNTYLATYGNKNYLGDAGRQRFPHTHYTSDPKHDITKEAESEKILSDITSDLISIRAIHTYNNLVIKTIGLSFQEYVLAKHDWDIKKFFETAANIDIRLFTSYDHNSNINWNSIDKRDPLNPKIIKKLVEDGLETIAKVEKALEL